MGGGLRLDGLLPGLVADLAAQLGARHADVAVGDPAVDRRGMRAELGRATGRYLGGREAPGHVESDLRHSALEVALLLVDPLAGLGQEPVGKRLGASGRVLALELLGAVVAAKPAAVARPGPRRKPRAGVPGHVRDPLALVGAFCDDAVPLRLVRDRGGRAAQVARHGPCASPLVERSLDGGPLVPVEPEASPLLLLCHALILSRAAGPLRACLRSRILGLNRTRSAES